MHFCMHFFLICLSYPFQNLSKWPKTKNTLIPILHVFAPLNDVRAYIAWSWKVTLITWFFFTRMISNFKYKWPLGGRGGGMWQISKYLGSKMTFAASDLKRRKALAWSAFWKLESNYPSLRKWSYSTIFLHGCESWVLSLDMESKINAFATSCYRIRLGIKRQDCISNIAIYSMTNTESCVLCNDTTARFPWTHPSSSRGKTCKKICFVCTTAWQKEAGSSTHLLHHMTHGTFFEVREASEVSGA